MRPRRRFVFLVLTLLAAGCATPLATRDEFVKRPYLQRPTTTEATVRWSTASPRACLVTYALEEKRSRTSRIPPEPVAAVEVQPFDFVGTRRREYLFRLRPALLKPGATYTYAVRCGESRHQGTFRTSPSPSGPLAPSAFTFIAYGDSRSGWDVHAELTSRFLNHRPAFILHTGDMVRRDTAERWQKNFFDPLGPTLAYVPLWPARGNHEGAAHYYRKYLDLPGGKTYYSFDYGNAHFVCLDSTGSVEESRMLEWCETDLAASKARWKFVFYHHPSYDVAGHLSHWGRKDFLPVFRKYGVDVVLTGHSHSYQRFHPMYTKGENQARPITHIVTGGGGAPLTTIKRSRPHVAAARIEYHYMVFQVAGDMLSCRVINDAGKEIDAFRIKKIDGQPDAASRAAAMREETFR